LPDVIGKCALEAVVVGESGQALNVTKFVLEHSGGGLVGASGQVLNVSDFLPENSGGELAILTLAGTDATKEF
jgi:hypothetical protein